MRAWKDYSPVMTVCELTWVKSEDVYRRNTAGCTRGMETNLVQLIVRASTPALLTILIPVPELLSAVAAWGDPSPHGAERIRNYQHPPVRNTAPGSGRTKEAPAEERWTA
jgi:hypothetical protein